MSMFFSNKEKKLSLLILTKEFHFKKKNKNLKKTTSGVFSVWSCKTIKKKKKLFPYKKICIFS